jgi:glyoxylase-like metal-dependent hydrolase (beta-lactamase superfamily II)
MPEKEDPMKRTPTRRIVMTALLAAPLAAAPFSASPVAAQEAAQEADFETTEIADGVYRFRWRFHNSFFVVTPDGVVAFDPISPEAAAHYAAEIRRVAPGAPLHALVYSHDHADHISGAPALFAELGEAPIIAQENALAKILAASDPDRTPPDSTFSDRSEVSVGGQRIELHYLGKSHSDNMVVAFLPGPKIAFAVDFVSHESVGYRDLPDWHYPEMYEAMERLQGIPYEKIVFGHGPVGDRSSVDGQIRYYEDLRAAVETAIDSGATKEEAVATVQLPEYAGWRGYDNWFPMNVGKMYDWLTAED